MASLRILVLAGGKARARNLNFISQVTIERPKAPTLRFAWLLVGRDGMWLGRSLRSDLDIEASKPGAIIRERWFIGSPNGMLSFQ